MLSEDLQALENYINKMKDKSVLCLFLLHGAVRFDIEFVMRVRMRYCESSQSHSTSTLSTMTLQQLFRFMLHLLKNCHIGYPG